MATENITDIEQPLAIIFYNDQIRLGNYIVTKVNGKIEGIKGVQIVQNQTNPID